MGKKMPMIQATIKKSKDSIENGVFVMKKNQKIQPFYLKSSA